MDARARTHVRTRRALAGIGGIGLLLAAFVVGAIPAAAHTDSDVVAVPAATQATVTLEPTHGCGGSPTVEVMIRAPMTGATAGPVPGWTATATPNGSATTLAWTGGSLPADEEGAFPVTFTGPDTPGELLVFPSVQRCADGQFLRWISGDPASEFPAPRVLVLARGSEPAATIDDVPAGTPGRELLAQIIDVDDPEATTTTLPPATTTTATPATTTTRDDEAAAESKAKSEEDDDAVASAIPWVVLAGLVVFGAGRGLISLQKKRDRS